MGQPANRRWALTAALALLPVVASAQGKLGYVDMKRLLDAAPQVQAGRERLQREFASRDAALLAKADADAKKREIDALDRSIKRNRESMRNDLKSRSDQELDKSWREINDAVVAFAREQGFDIIVPSPVVYASARVDITDQVLERLRKQFREKPGGATP